MLYPIPHIDIFPANKRVRAGFFSELKSWYDKGAFSGGEYVERFEKEFADYLDVPHCMGVNSGTSALQIGRAHV